MTSILIDDDFVLRSFLPEDAQALFQCVDESRAKLRPWLNWVDQTTRPEHSLEFIKMVSAWKEAGNGFVLGIFTSADNKVVGVIGMNSYVADQSRAQLGYWIHPSFEGQGLMYRAAQRFIDFLFARLRLNKVEIRMVSENLRSAALAARLGAKVEGCIRASYLSGGVLHDMLITGILRSEWEETKAGF